MLRACTSIWCSHNLTEAEIGLSPKQSASARRRPLASKEGMATSPPARCKSLFGRGHSGKLREVFVMVARGRRLGGVGMGKILNKHLGTEIG